MRSVGFPSYPPRVTAPPRTCSTSRPWTCTGCGMSTCWLPSATAWTSRPPPWAGPSTTAPWTQTPVRPGRAGGEQRRNGCNFSQGSLSTSSQNQTLGQISPPPLRTIYCRLPAGRKSSIIRSEASVLASYMWVIFRYPCPTTRTQHSSAQQ